MTTNLDINDVVKVEWRAEWLRCDYSSFELSLWTGDNHKHTLFFYVLDAERCGEVRAALAVFPPIEAKP